MVAVSVTAVMAMVGVAVNGAPPDKADPGTVTVMVSVLVMA